MLTSGSIVAGRFRLERLLGEGGMGTVWAATHLVTKRPMALKFLKSGLATSSDTVRRFLREARAASAVRHPNVVEIHDVLELDDGLPVMVMDLLIGESLGSRVARERKLLLAAAAEIMVPVLSAVGTAHALGIVHRDLKPDNIFLERLGDGTTAPKVLDFGIAKLSGMEGAAAKTAELTNTGSVMGTPFYMAPEQIFGEKDVDQRADVWAFGVILYEVLAGQRPMNGDSFGQLLKAITMGTIVPIEQVAPELPVDVTTLIGRMLSLERSGRPNDLREPFEILRRHTDGRAISFAAPRMVDSHSGGGRPAPGADFAFAATELSDRAPAEVVTGSGGFSSTKGTTFFQRYRRRTMLLGASTFAMGLVAIVLTRPIWNRLFDSEPDEIVGSPSTPSSTVGATPPSAPTIPPTAPVVSPTSSVEAAVTSSTPAPSSSSPKARQRRHTTPTPSATSGAVPTATTTSTGPVATSTQRLPGGVASAAPF